MGCRQSVSLSVCLTPHLCSRDKWQLCCISTHFTRSTEDESSSEINISYQGFSYRLAPDLFYNNGFRNNRDHLSILHPKLDLQIKQPCFILIVLYREWTQRSKPQKIHISHIGLQGWKKKEFGCLYRFLSLNHG